jgi:hypothetical protein
MKLFKTANGKTTVKMSKQEWINVGKKVGWLKKSKIIPDDGYQDGGMAYTDEEMDRLDAKPEEQLFLVVQFKEDGSIEKLVKKDLPEFDANDKKKALEFEYGYRYKNGRPKFGVFENDNPDVLALLSQI